MVEEHTNRIEIDWKDLFKPISGLQTGPADARVINEIIIKQEIIPIIFVPGIMGSRLKYNTGDETQRDETPQRAWDPDGQGFMALNYGLFGSPKNRKKMLIGEQSHNSNYLSVDNDNAKHNKKLPDGMSRNGWGGVYWGIYGKILKTLARHDWPEPLNACFHFPVYAFGYNWTASNRESGRRLADFIQNTIEENAKQSLCTQVILVTHSMGGLVARAACKLHSAEASVLGVVHGVQPATGSAEAYFRMKTGFEPPGSPTGKLWDWLRNPVMLPISKFKGTAGNLVLGNCGKDVTIIMANSPGALELLPNKLYKDNNGSTQWLSYTDKLGKRTDMPNGDPYANIYSLKKPAYRLVNPKWLGDKADSNKKNRYEIKGKNAWEYYKQNLDIAAKFHDDLADSLHPETYQFYATGIKTVDRVEIESKKRDQQRLLYFEAKDKKKCIMEIRDEDGEKILSPEDDDFTIASSGKKCIVYSLKPPSGAGDGTVPESSGKALKAGAPSYSLAPDTTVAINENDENWYNQKHDNIYNTKTARHITLKAIENLCKHKIKKETGAA